MIFQHIAVYVQMTTPELPGMPIGLNIYIYSCIEQDTTGNGNLPVDSGTMANGFGLGSMAMPSADQMNLPPGVQIATQGGTCNQMSLSSQGDVNGSIEFDMCSVLKKLLNILNR